MLDQAQRYILDPKQPGYDDQIQLFRAQFAKEGALVLPGFVSAANLKTMVSESLALSERAFHNFETSTIFLESPDPALPEDHVKRMVDHSKIHVIANDQIPDCSKLRELYLDQHLTSFIRDVAGVPSLYRYGCPLGALNYQLMKEGDGVRWHYDISDFVAAIPIQDADQGEAFEYVHNLRLTDNPSCDLARSYLKEEAGQASILESPLGSLVLFRGKNTLHRVTKIQGDKPRINALLGYATKPGHNSSDFVKMMRYGRIQVIRPDES